MRLIAAGIAALGLAIAVALAVSSSWKARNIVITDLHGTSDTARLELCGAGHFDQGGPLRELLYRAGMGPTDNEAAHCVVIDFDGPARPGEFALSGEGRYRSDARGPRFSPAPGHSAAIKNVTLTLSCFCGDSDEPATFDGVLKLDALEPPRGRLELTVTTATGVVSRLDVPLRRFTWTNARDGY